MRPLRLYSSVCAIIPNALHIIYTDIINGASENWTAICNITDRIIILALRFSVFNKLKILQPHKCDTHSTIRPGQILTINIP